MTKPYMADHRVENKPVLPAVIAMHLLANSTRAANLLTRSATLSQITFKRFLYLENLGSGSKLYNEIEKGPDENICTRLISRTRAAKSGITRTKTHVSLVFIDQAPMLNSTPKVPPIGDTQTFQIPYDRLYGELVVFGQAFQNITGPVHLTRKWGWAAINGGIDIEDPSPLGSPFPLDAAFHIACAWSQRYAGFVAFPVAIAERRIFEPTVAGGAYYGLIRPISQTLSETVFDLWVYSDRDQLMEMAKGVRMRDVTGGRIRPSDWVRKNA